MAQKTKIKHIQLELEFTPKQNNFQKLISLIQINEIKRIGKPCQKLQQIEFLYNKIENLPKI